VRREKLRRPLASHFPAVTSPIPPEEKYEKYIANNANGKTYAKQLEGIRLLKYLFRTLKIKDNNINIMYKSYLLFLFHWVLRY
jgi:hypothetical protein